jgi:alcohol dehydrogenase class IV
VLPQVVRFNATERGRETALAAEAAGARGELADAMAALQRRCSLHPRLSELGVPRGELPEVADAALADVVIANAPRTPTRHELAGLLEDAF